MLKRILDLCIGAAVLVILSPVLFLVAIAIRLDSKGQILFVQERLGKDGVPFKMYKFRSMVVGAENIGSGLFSYADDPRITKVGALIRRTSIDELPQILNVMKGDMALVGPRPIVTYEHGNYSEFEPIVRKRFTVKPGITGLAQTVGRNQNTWAQKVEFDNIYVDRFARFGVFEDLRILAKTFFVVLSMKNTIEGKDSDA